MFLSSYIKSGASVFVLAFVFSLSCKKQNVYEGVPIMLTTFNGLNDGVALYGNYSEQHPITYKYAQLLPNGATYPTYIKDPGVHARYFASPDTLAKDLPVIDENFNLEKGKIYSVYLMGDKTAAEFLLVDNQLNGYKPGDSVTYLQVVNISNDQPISVNVKGEADGSLINSLAYKNASAFVELRVDQAHPNYEFEFRDAATGELLFTHFVPFMYPAPGESSRYLHRNWAMVFRGKRGVTDVNAIKVQSVFLQ